MTTFTFRPQTLDFDIFCMVYFHNEYQLPMQLASDDLIIDVGAHIGSFAFACLVRGAGHVISIEPHPDNHALAKQHLQPYMASDQVNLRWGAVWRSDNHQDTLAIDNIPPADTTLINTGNLKLKPADSASSFPIFALDDLILHCAPQRVRLLKLDCEGSEFPILLTAKQLGSVDEIVGEFHEWDLLSVGQKPSIDKLVAHLQAQGFVTTVQRHHRYVDGTWRATALGYFRAVRQV